MPYTLFSLHGNLKKLLRHWLFPVIIKYSIDYLICRSDKNKYKKKLLFATDGSEDKTVGELIKIKKCDSNIITKNLYESEEDFIILFWRAI